MKHHAFSLLELLCCLTIAAILSAACLPNYQHQLRESHRLHTQTQMLQLAHALEKQFASLHHYQPNRLNTANPHYTIDIATNKTTYEITATPLKQQRHDRCGTLRVSQTGIQQAQHTSCW